MKRNVFIFLVAGITAFLSVILLNKKHRQDVLERLTDLKRSIQLKNNVHLPIIQAGDRDVENLDNSKMVSEGSQYGVEYYNRVMQ